MTEVNQPPGPWQTAAGPVSLSPPVVMGVLNVTPDSFSDGGQIVGPQGALRRARAMVDAGAAILDVGGESTRPGAPSVSPEEEIQRVLPVVELLRGELPVPISIDTRKAVVAREALAAGAAIVNDISGLSFDPAMGRVVEEFGAGLVLMHMRGTPADMMERTRYGDVLGEVMDELEEGLGRAWDAGIAPEAVVVDPGIGFAKTADQSFRLLGELDRFQELGRPVLVGPSRKSFLGALLGVPPAERITATAVACALSWERGARIFRVHDVKATVQALQVVQAVTAGRIDAGRNSPARPSSDPASSGDRDPGGIPGVESAVEDSVAEGRTHGRAVRGDG